MTVNRKKSNLTELESASRWTLSVLRESIMQKPSHLGCIFACIQPSKKIPVSAQLQDFMQYIQMLVVSGV